MRGPVTTSFELGVLGGGGGGGEGGLLLYGNLFYTIIVTKSKCICYVGKAKFVCSLFVAV